MWPGVFLPRVELLTQGNKALSNADYIKGSFYLDEVISRRSYQIFARKDYQTMSKNVIEMDNITKRFGSFTAVDDVTFHLRKGEIHALLGENGAGKTTLVNVLFGLYAQIGRAHV